MKKFKKFINEPKETPINENLGVWLASMAGMSVDDYLKNWFDGFEKTVKQQYDAKTAAEVVKYTKSFIGKPKTIKDAANKIAEYHKMIAQASK